MERMLIDRRKTSFFSAISNDLSYGELKLAPLMNRTFSIANFSEQIEEKSRSYNHSFREVLSKELNAQYKGLEIKNIVQLNIEALNNSNTFTVVTGHQLNLFGGPMYIIYKIANIIKLA